MNLFGEDNYGEFCEMGSVCCEFQRFNVQPIFQFQFNIFGYLKFNFLRLRQYTKHSTFYAIYKHLKSLQEHLGSESLSSNENRVNIFNAVYICNNIFLDKQPSCKYSEHIKYY